VHIIRRKLAHYWRMWLFQTRITSDSEITSLTIQILCAYVHTRSSNQSKVRGRHNWRLSKVACGSRRFEPGIRNNQIRNGSWLPRLVEGGASSDVTESSMTLDQPGINSLRIALEKLRRWSREAISPRPPGLRSLRSPIQLNKHTKTENKNFLKEPPIYFLHRLRPERMRGMRDANSRAAREKYQTRISTTKTSTRASTFHSMISDTDRSRKRSSCTT
jgi:hypothetical protein